MNNQRTESANVPLRVEIARQPAPNSISGARLSRGRGRGSKSSQASRNAPDSKPSERKLRTSSKKLVDKYPKRFYSSERYSPTEGGQHVNVKSGAPSQLRAPVLAKSKSVSSIPQVNKNKAAEAEAGFSAQVQRLGASSKVKPAVPPEPVQSQSQELFRTGSDREMRQLSLIEQKKQQWAKEREEMNGLWSPWGRPSTSIGPQHTGIVARGELNEISASSKYLQQSGQGQQSPTAMRNAHHQLISFSNNNGEEYKSSYNYNHNGGGGTPTPTTTLPSFNFNYYNVEDDHDHTSGYQSDNGGGGSRHNSGAGAKYKTREQGRGAPIPAQMSRSYEYRQSLTPHAAAAPPASAMRSSFAIGTGVSDAGYIDEMKEQERALWLRDLKAQMTEQNQRKEAERSRWGDKGICVGHFWEPDNVLLPPNSADSNPPAWANGYTRPLTSLSLSHSKSQPSLFEPQQQESLVYTMNQSIGDLRNASQSANVNTFLRGQNVPVDPEELQEKEMKRIAALQHQQAILQQIEERQQRLKEERERRARQEALDEQRIREQQLKLLERAEQEKRLKEQLEGDADDDGGHVHIFQQPLELQPQSRSRSRHGRALEPEIESVPIAVLNRRQQFRPQNSVDVIDFEHVRNLTSESVQTEAVDMLPRSPRREIGIQTEVPAAKEKSKTKGAVNVTSADPKTHTSTRPPAPTKPRWGAGGPTKKPYVKQSEKDPLYQERMNRINSKRRNWLDKKAEEKVNQAAGGSASAYSSDFSASGEGRRFSQSSTSSTIQQQQQSGRVGRISRAEQKKVAAEMLERQKRQFRQLQLQEAEAEVDGNGDEEAKTTAEIVRRQSQYLDEIDGEYLEKLVEAQARRRASVPPSTSTEATDAAEISISTGRRQRRSTSSSPTKIPVAIAGRSRRPSDKAKARVDLGVVESSDEREAQDFAARASARESSTYRVETKRNPKPKPTAAGKKSQRQPVKEVKSTARTGSTSISRNSRSRQGQDRRAIPEEGVGVPVAPRCQSPPVPALMKRIQMGVNPEEFGKMELSYEIPEKANIDSTPPAPAPPLPPPAPLTRRIEKTMALPPVSFVVAVGQEKGADEEEFTVSNQEGRKLDPKPQSEFESPPIASQHHHRAERLKAAAEIEEEPEEESQSQSPKSSPEETTNTVAEYTQELEPEPPGYFTSYIRPPFSPRFNHYFLDTDPAREQEQLSARPSTRDSEFSARRRLISSLMTHGEVQEQISAREDELSQTGIIEFSIHLPRLYSGGSGSGCGVGGGAGVGDGLFVATRFDGDSEEKLLHCSQPSSPASGDERSTPMLIHSPAYGYGGYGYGYGYQDPLQLDSAAQRRAATISWLCANDGGRGARGRADSDPYILARLSSLKRGIQHQQVEWNANRSPSAGVGGPLPLQLRDYEYNEDYENSRRTRHERELREREREAMLLEY